MSTAERTVERHVPSGNSLRVDKPISSAPAKSASVEKAGGAVSNVSGNSAKGDQGVAALEIAGLRKTFHSTEALAGVSFRVAVGERLALLGPNGAGKTTLIRCISGRSRPDAGTVRLFGRSIAEAGVRDALGLVPQEIAVYGDLTTYENLVAFGRFHGLGGSELRRRVEWALEWTGLGDRARSLVGNFSGGMKRRVNLACGVLHSPSVLLLDEPTVGVDPQSRERIFNMLDELNRGGTSIVLTTHHLDEAQERCDRVVIMDHGQVVADGTLPQLVASTVGPSRLVTLRMDRSLEGPITLPHSLRLIGSYPAVERPGRSTPRPEHSLMVGATGDKTISTRIDDVATQLPQLLHSLRASGYGVSDVEVHAPTLHHVFLHLTGHELRD